MKKNVGRKKIAWWKKKWRKKKKIEWCKKYKKENRMMKDSIFE
jgi:hypothetical protein